LVETLEPPTMAAKGRCGAVTTPHRKSSSCHARRKSLIAQMTSSYTASAIAVSQGQHNSLISSIRLVDLTPLTRWESLGATSVAHAVMHA
jgi:hypothetical protein